MIAKICGIYKILNVITRDYYLGGAVHIRRRWNEHRRDLVANRHDNIHLQRAWNKYGKQAFEFSVVLLCDIEHKLYFEQWLINLLKPAYNIAEDALAPMQGRHHTEESKRKLSEAHKGKRPSDEVRANMREAWTTRPPMSEETKLKRSELTSGERNPNFGKHLSEEAKRHLSEINSGELHPMFGKHQSDETKHKRSKSNMGKHLMSEEHRRIVSEANKGKVLSEEHKGKLLEANIGRHMSEKTKQKMSESAKRRWAEQNENNQLTSGAL